MSRRLLLHHARSLIRSNPYLQIQPTCVTLVTQPHSHYSAPLHRNLTTTTNKNSKRTIKDRVMISPSPTNAQIVHVKLSRPSKLNSLDVEMFEAIAEAATELAKDEDVRVVILSGEGRAFCTGLDAKAVMTHGPNPYKTLSKLLDRPLGSAGNLVQDVAYLWRKLPVPVIVVLHGMCYGGGLQIALGADFRVTTPTTRLSFLEAQWGLIPDMAVSLYLRQLLPMDKAKELLMTGQILTGNEAADLGLVTRAVEDPWQEAQDLAERLVLHKSPDAVTACKLLLEETWENEDEEECLRVETELQKQLVGGWNQVAASMKTVGWKKVPFGRRRDLVVTRKKIREYEEEEKK